MILTAQIQAIAEQLAPLCEGDEQLFHDMLVGETDIDRIVTRLHEQIMRDEEMLVGIAERQSAIAERKARIKNRAERFKEQIGIILQLGKLTKLELPEVTYSVRMGKPSLEVISEAVPDEFTRVKREPDKVKINAAFENEDTLPNWLRRTEARLITSARTK